MDEPVRNEKSCTYCHQALNAISGTVTCSGCGAVLHKQCWQDNSGCNTFSCNGKPILPATPATTMGGAVVVPRPAPSTPLERAMPQVPVWAPNPAVPLVARILAYSFAFMMLLTSFLSYTTWRPVSLPEAATKWEKPFTSSLGYTISYPEKWKVITREVRIQNDSNNKYIKFFPDRIVLPSSEVEVLIIPAPGENAVPFIKYFLYTDDIVQLPGTSTDSQNTVLQEFTFERLSNGGLPFRVRATNMHGSWTVVDNNDQQLVVVGVAPEEGWKVMSGIFTPMVNNMTVVK